MNPLLLLVAASLSSYSYQRTTSGSFSGSGSTDADPRLLGGYNTVLGTIQNLSFFDTALMTSVKQLHTGILRYPGGTVANYWSIKNATYVTPCSANDGNYTYNYCDKKQLVDDVKSTRVFSPGNFTAGVASVTAATHLNPSHAVVYDINVLTQSEEATIQDLLVLREQVGAENVKYIELGNEFYLPHEDYRAVFPNATVYCEKMTPIVKQIRQLFPQAKVSPPAVRRTTTSAPWNNELSKYPDLFDAVTYHDYSMQEYLIKNLSDTDQIQYLSSYGRVIIPQCATNVRTTFGQNKTLWITEYNDSKLDDSNLTMAYNATHAMYMLGYVFGSACASEGTVEMLLLHVLATEHGITWSNRESVLQLSSADNDLNNTKFTISGQIMSQMGYLALRKGNRMSCFKESEEGPTISVDVLGVQNISCVAGMSFFGNDSFSAVFTNACPFDVNVTVSVYDINLMGDSLTASTYPHTASGFGYFSNCKANASIWDPSCAAYVPKTSHYPVSGQQFTAVLESLSVVFLESA